MYHSKNHIVQYRVAVLDCHCGPRRFITQSITLCAQSGGPGLPLCAELPSCKYNVLILAPSLLVSPFRYFGAPSATWQSETAIAHRDTLLGTGWRSWAAALYRVALLLLKHLRVLVLALRIVFAISRRVPCNAAVWDCHRTQRHLAQHTAALLDRRSVQSCPVTITRLSLSLSRPLSAY